MLIGDKSAFAIECEIRDRSDSFTYCNFRFWIAGAPIGDWDEQTVLGVLVHSATVIMRYQSNRHLAQANSMNTGALWHHIDRFANSDDPEDQRIGLEERYRQRFLLHELADDSVGRKFEVIIVDCADGTQRLLWKSRNSNVVKEIRLPELSIDKIVGDFLLWAGSFS